MKRWIMMVFSLALFSQAYAADVTVSCQELGTDNIQECVLSSTKDSADKVYGISNMPYALCSMTACKSSVKGNFTECECELINDKTDWKSFSASPTSYVSAKPTYNKDGTLQTVQSNYSMANITDFAANPTQQCNYDRPQPWANCYGVRCSVTNAMVDGKMKQIASCICPVKSDKSFLIGATEKSACEDKRVIWSATTGSDFAVYGNNPMVILYEKAFPQSPPIKDAKQ